MQVPQADSSQSKRVGVDEEFIKFRSSSNFQVMKKFIRSKIDKTETSNRSSPNNHPDPPNAEPAVTKVDLQAVADKLESTADAQPSNAYENEEYPRAREAEPREGATAQEEAKRGEGGEEGKPPESTIMCRDFIRGTCKRPGTCRYAHKCDKTQLFGVYTFCRNFQNSVCTRPNCKYVHASVFDEQEFYRSGKLPPHVMPPKVHSPPPPLPPPPPPGDPVQESRVDIPTSFANPPPQLPPSMEANTAMFAGLPTNATEPRLFQEEFGVARDISYEPPLKKCKNCDSMEIRYRCINDLLEKKREMTEELKRKTGEVETKKEKMVVILKGLLKLGNKSATSGPSSLSDKIFEQLVNMNSGNRITVGGGDASGVQGLLGENLGMATMLANILSEPARGVDGGRRE